ncbi:MAG TPA: hypothetical protein VFA66_04390 [Gaiellaceae bacterium]|nr:hypothetical protein [Gaiellaceae bacterium]
MSFLPEPLLQRLDSETADLLDYAVDHVLGALRDTYERECRDHDPSVGDNRYTFGQNVYHHSSFAIRKRVTDARVGVTADNHPLCWRLEIRGITMRVYKMGSHLPLNIHTERLEPTSAAKELVGSLNDQFVQLELDIDAATPRTDPDEASYAARELVVGHFGNPDSGLMGVFFGAPRREMQNGSYWNWVVRLDAGHLPVRVDEDGVSWERTVPYSELKAPEIKLELHDGAGEQVNDEKP